LQVLTVLLLSATWRIFFVNNQKGQFMNALSNDQMNQVSGGALVTLFKAVIKGAGYVGTAITVSYSSYKAAKKKASKK